MGFNSKTQKRKMKLLAALTALTSAIDPLMLMMMSGGMGGGGMDIGSNPILLLQLLKGDSGSSGLKDLLPLMMMSGGMGGMGAGMGAGGMQGMLPLLMLMGDESDSSWSPKPAAEYAAVCSKIVDLSAKSECDNNFGKIYSGCSTSDTTACTYICDAAGAAASCDDDDGGRYEWYGRWCRWSTRCTRCTRNGSNDDDESFGTQINSFLKIFFPVPQKL